MSSAPAPAAGRGRLPVQTRDRRAALSALALLLVVAGALGAALVVYRTGQRVDVLTAAHEVKPGQQVSASDFQSVRVSADTGNIIKASQLNTYVGTFATVDIPSGTLVNHLMFQGGSVVPSDGVLVGVSLSQTQRPASSISTGDIVRAYRLPKSSSSDQTTQGATVLVSAARVVNVASSASSGTTITVSLLVDSATAQSVIAAAAQGDVAVAELPNSTKPAIDFQTTP